MMQSIGETQKEWGAKAITLAALYIIGYAVLVCITSSRIGPFGSATSADLTQRYEGSINFDAP